jgi:branched-chain amino acid transport system permease protein
VSGDSAGRTQNYYIAWGTLVLGLFLLLNLMQSRVGRALRAIHGSEEAACAMGVNIARFKLQTFVLSAVFAAVAGVLLTHYNGGIGPSEAGVMKSVRYVAIVAVGGMAHLWGAMSMGVLLNFLSLRGVFGTYDDAVFGLILIVIMLFAPDGILSLVARHKVAQGVEAPEKGQE